jgi:hypothetical protein
LYKKKEMNIQNLNPQELEQLQTLLNKMNPTTQPTEIDPVEQMIDSIMENFDFKEVQRAMDLLDWEWRGEYVTIEMLVKEAERLLRGAMESRLGSFRHESHELGIVNGTGGLEAKAWCDETKTKIVALDLKFVLESWDESIEE